jgi:flagellar hook protein FlgE
MINRIAVSGLNGSNHILRTLQDNISNVRTTAFKGEHAATLDAWQMAYNGGGARPEAVTRNLTQGPLQRTGNVLDLALEGPGYFAARDGESQVFTRAGSFSVGAEGQILTDTGHALLGYPGLAADKVEGDAPGVLKLPLPLANDASLTIDTKGQVLLEDPRGATLIGTLAVAKFQSESDLEPLSMSDFGATEGSGAPIFGAADGNRTGMYQQQLEQANVNLMEQLTALISVQNAFSAQAKSLSTYDDMIKTSLSDMR